MVRVAGACARDSDATAMDLHFTHHDFVRFPKLRALA
jgi:hypothetical protein